MHEAQIRDELAASTLVQLEAQAKRVWQLLAAGALEEGAAERLSNEIATLQQARSARSSAASDQAQPGSAPRTFPRPSIFPAKIHRQRLRDRREARRDARALAAAGGMPPAIANRFTGSEQAVLFIVAAECWNRGACDRSIDELADRASVSTSTVKRALRHAEDLDLVRIERRPQKGAKHLPNVVRITSKEWKTWLSKRKPIGVQKRTASGREDSKRSIERSESGSAAPNWTTAAENRGRGELVRLEEWKARR